MFMLSSKLTNSLSPLLSPDSNGLSQPVLRFHASFVFIACATIKLILNFLLSEHVKNIYNFA